MASAPGGRERLLTLVYFLLFWPIFIAANLLTLALRSCGWRRLLPKVQHALSIKRRVLYLEVFSPDDSGYVYRVRDWAMLLTEEGYTVRARWVLRTPEAYLRLRERHLGMFQLSYLVRRLLQVLAAPSYNCVVVRRELLLYNDYGDLFLERLLLALNPNVVLDFDDDIAAAKGEPRVLTRFGRLMREAPSKFNTSLDLYPRFIAGSRYLATLLLERRDATTPVDVTVVPTCVNYEGYGPRDYSPRRELLTFGWIGGNENLRLLELVFPALNELAQRERIRLVVISGRPVGAAVGFEIVNRPWSLETQVRDLLEVDVGLMPLRNTLDERGKCGFKLIQYMALGIVGVASAVTTNREIVEDGEDGFLVEPAEEWSTALRRVLARRPEFGEIGRKARAKAGRLYSHRAHKEEYAAFIERACQGESSLKKPSLFSFAA